MRAISLTVISAYLALGLLLGLMAGCGGPQATEYYANEYTEHLDTWPEAQLTYNQGYNQFEYNDEGMQIAFSINEESDWAFNFTLVNNTGGPVIIYWNQSSFVNMNNLMHHVIHDGVDYWSLESAQTPSEVLAGATLNDLIRPARLADQDGGLRLAPVTGQMLSNGSWGQRVTLLLKMNVEGQDRMHRFTFDLSGIQTPANWGPYY